MLDKPDEGLALPNVEHLVTQEQIERYAVASGDFNPVHVDQEFAAGSRFGGTIAHGMMVAASISQMMTAAFREDWLASGTLKIRFRAPVYPGDSIEAFGRIEHVHPRDQGREVVCSVGVRKQDGELAITGDATVTVRSVG